MKKLIKLITEVFENAFEEAGYDKSLGMVTSSNRPDLCQYQCNGAMAGAKKYKKRPLDIAQEVVAKINSDIFSEVVVVNPGFINIKLQDSYLKNYIEAIAADSKFGVEASLNPQTIVLDYGGANVAKPLHVGHLRTAIIGETIKRMAKYLGHTVIGDVHLGDWGLQMGMIITEVKRRNPELPYFDDSFTGEYPEEAPFTISDLEEIYPTASKKAKEDPALMQEAQAATVELQNGKPGYVALWKHILNVSKRDLKKNYDNLNVDFDLWNGESDSQKYIDTVVTYLKENNYAYESKGALVVDVAEETDTKEIPPIIILKSDGASLYSTTDVATIYERVKEFNPDTIMYVVDKRQELHFEQVFRCVNKTKIASEKLNLQFIGYGTMNGKDGKPFKTREGGVMRLENLVGQVRDTVKAKILENKSEMDGAEAEDIAKKVGLAAVKYGDLSNQISKDYIFDIDKFTSFDGKTGPYILYTIVRIKSILRKAGKISEGELLAPKSATERDILLKVTTFNDTLEFSFNERAPHKLCEYMFELANLFNKFYGENKILSEENEATKASWLKLISIVKNVLETCCDIMAIEVPEKM
ncbi:arginine--tRNA ligase [Clostridium sp. 19966]|uniref:arginine--tRNA ligase n=1 Tax=Clostridium sp. 19966 TaxID=2768166 RepID=UPI0028DD5946|nr:arginine--tRNA ligase [Clostridium sp. 19966]MDT8717840.1 arginine--tRNA ligase [Clostridium sp. 19966]